MSAERVYRFDGYEFDAERRELRRNGQLVPLQPQPAQVLATLLERAGELVTRQELRRAVWPDDTFVDFDRGLNFCIAQIRAALDDDAQRPRFIRTLPKRGYEFLTRVNSPEPPGIRPADPESRPKKDNTSGPASASLQRIMTAVPIVLLVAAGAAWVVEQRAARPIVAVARFDNETGDASQTRLADLLADTVVERLATDGEGTCKVIGNAAILRRPRDQRDLDVIRSSLHADYVVLGQVQRNAGRVRVLAHLIHLPDQTHVAVSRIDQAENTDLVPDQVAATIVTAIERRLARRSDSPAR